MPIPETAQEQAVLRIYGFAILLALILLPACGGPFLVFPGGKLEGEVIDEPVTDWSFVDDLFVHLETRPAKPYSVELNYIVKQGDLFIDPAEGRRWLDYIREDANVRVAFSGKIYPLRAVLIARPGELEGFPQDRFIYRLDPREPAH